VILPSLKVNVHNGRGSLPGSIRIQIIADELVNVAGLGEVITKSVEGDTEIEFVILGSFHSEDPGGTWYLTEKVGNEKSRTPMIVVVSCRAFVTIAYWPFETTWVDSSSILMVYSMLLPGLDLASTNDLYPSLRTLLMVNK